MNINTKTKLIGAVLCALGVMSSDFACAADGNNGLGYYNGVYGIRHPLRQAESVMTMFGGLTVKAGNIQDEARKNEAFKLIYDAMCSYFRLQSALFDINVDLHPNDSTYVQYAEGLTADEFRHKIEALEKFFDIATDKDRERLARIGEGNVPILGTGSLKVKIINTLDSVGNTIVNKFALNNPTNNYFDAICAAGDLDLANNTPAKQDALMFFRGLRSGMSLSNFGYSMITPQGKEFIGFVINMINAL